jgi:DNA polymerase I
VTTNPPWYLLDASLYVFRAYHALEADWHDRDGFPTHAVHGFANFVLNFLEQVKPQHMVVCFDEAFDHSFRNELYPAYKANREPPTADLVRQFAHCQTFCTHLGLNVLADSRFEADDLIGTLATRAKNEGRAVSILSADKDLAQLLGRHDRLWDFGRAEPLDGAAVEMKFGVRPDQMVDWLALAGDSSDNIPGVGTKTASQLLKHFGSLDELYARLEDVPYLRLRGAAAAYNHLKNGRESALLSRQLSAIACEVPAAIASKTLRQNANLTSLDELFDHCGFGPLLRSRVRRLPNAV